MTTMTSPLPILPTTVIGSYSMPEWLERAKNDYLQRASEPPRSRRDARRRAQGGDQGPGGRRRRHRLRRRAAARQHDRLLHRAAARRAGRSGLEALLLRLLRQRRPLEAGDRIARPVRRGAFLRRFTDARPKVSISGPHTLVKRIQNEHYPTEEAFALDLGARAEPRAAELVRAGATELQIDEPYYSGFPEDLPWAIKAVNAMVDGVERATSRCTSATATATASRRSRAATGICSRRSSRRKVHADVARVRAARRGGPAAVQGVQRAVHARARRHRRQDARRRVGRRSSPTASAARSRSFPAERLDHQSRLRAACTCRATSRSAS